METEIVVTKTDNNHKQPQSTTNNHKPSTNDHQPPQTTSKRPQTINKLLKTTPGNY